MMAIRRNREKRNGEEKRKTKIANEKEWDRGRERKRPMCQEKATEIRFELLEEINAI